MSFEHWLAFSAAAAVLLLIPGPTVVLIVSYALGHGRKVALASVAGVALGDVTSMTASMLGLGALLATSAELFTVLKWIGAAYLVYLGIKLWRAPVADPDEAVETPTTSPWRTFLHIYVVTALNPKGITFFLAFLPQFLDLTQPIVPQMAIFEATFVVLATVNATGYALMASAARGVIRRPPVQRAVNRVGGSVLAGAGVLTVAWKHSS